MFRADVEGLRALAVLAVLLFHFDVDVLQGGFLGVDFFFVISGYVISKGIYSRVGAGTFRFSDFYTRRFRRIMPALIATIAIVLVAGFLLSPVQHFKDLSLSAVFAALSVSNFYFPEATGYFGHQATQIPLLHMWSLSVEEQFYFVWPLVFVLLLKYVGKDKLLTALTLLTVLFIVVSQFWVFRDSKYAFYMSPVRFFEFLLGAWVVIAEGKYAPKNTYVYDGLFITGLVICLATLFGFNENTVFPGVTALAPTLSIAMMIFSGSKTSCSRVFSNPCARFFGKISYSLYLVHWPLVVFYKSIHGYSLAWEDTLGLLVVSILLAYLMWRYIEQPFRGKASGGVPAANRAFYIGLASAFTAVLATSWWVYDNAGLPWRMDGSSQEIYRNYTTRISMVPDCKANSKLPAGFACFGSQDPVAADAILIGDSHVRNFRPGLSELFHEMGIQAVYTVNNGCPPIPGAKVMHGALPLWHYLCEGMNKSGFDYALQQQFSVVILAGRWGLYTNDSHLGAGLSTPTIFLALERGDKGDASQSQAVFDSKITNMVEELVAKNKKVILFGQVPETGFDIERCLFTPDFLDLEYAGCSQANRAETTEYIAFTNSVLRRIAADNPDHVLFLDSSLPFCEEECIYMKGKVPLYVDDNHLSSSGSLFAVEYFSKEISAFIGNETTTR